jgi:hypothetical protein
MRHFRLIFRPDERYGAMGGAWVQVCPDQNGPEGQDVVTHGDCSPLELEHQIAALKAELDAVLREAKAKSAAYMSAKASNEKSRRMLSRPQR